MAGGRFPGLGFGLSEGGFLLCPISGLVGGEGFEAPNLGLVCLDLQAEDLGSGGGDLKRENLGDGVESGYCIDVELPFRGFLLRGERVEL